MPVFAKANEEFCIAAAARYPDAEIFVSNRANACTVLCLHQNSCRLLYRGDAVPRQIDEVFGLAVSAGYHYAGDVMLVDFTEFTGIIDWDFAKTRTVLTPGMQPQPIMVAYVAHDYHALLSARAIIFWLRHYTCRTFMSVQDAERWLGIK